MSDTIRDRYKASLSKLDWSELHKISDRPRKVQNASAAMLVGAGFAVKLKGSWEITPEGLVALKEHGYV